MASHTRLIYEFDDFQLEPDDRKLLRHGQVIPLSGKAFEMLLVLIRNHGKLLTKDELFQMVWPDQIVEESNLTVNMSAIRRALGEKASTPRYITTISGRGYRFNGQVRQFADEALTIERETFARLVVEEEETESGTSILPFAGRVANVVRRLTSHPIMLLATCLTIVVIGGIGVWVRGVHRTEPYGWTNVRLHPFPTYGGVPFRAVISPDGKSIVYRQRINGKESLWLGQIDSNSSVKISEQPGLSMASLALSPDGQNVFVTMCGRVSSANKLMRMPIVGGVMTEVLAHIDSAVSFSPDGRQIAFLRRDDDSQNTSIVMAEVDGKNQRILLAGQPPTIVGMGLSWSPDGKYIAFAGNEDGRDRLLAVSVADGKVMRLGRQVWERIGNMTWLPDGHGLAVSAVENTVTRRCSIWYVSYPEGEARKLTNDLDMYLPDTISANRNGTVAVLQGHNTYEILVAPEGDAKRAQLALQGVEPRYEGADGLAWTPDGRVIYSAYVGDGQAIWSMNRDGSNLQQLTTNDANFVDRETSATADGRYLVFESNRSGSFQIWRAGADGRNLKQLTHAGTNSQPTVSPDGKWIVYASNRSGRSTLWRMSIDGDQESQLTNATSIGPEISPDGKFIAYLQDFNSPAGRLAVMPFEGGPPALTFSLPDSVYLACRLRWTLDNKAVMYRDSVQGLWKQSLNEEKPQFVKGFENVTVSHFAWSLDGKSLVYNRGAIMRDIVLLENSR